MSPTFKEYIFDFTDLKLLSLVCGQCGCEMIVDCSNDQCRVPRSCSACQTGFDAGFNMALEAFGTAYLNFKKRPTGAAKAQIRIRREVNLPEG